VLVGVYTLKVSHCLNQGFLPNEFMAINYRTTDVSGMKIFYREAGSPTAPALLLLHGFPTSSHMFRNLIPLLAGKFHLVAPDFPGFGQSDMPDRKK
jgi:pimeloyl-ACP methyl ester carboxylesterase